VQLLFFEELTGDDERLADFRLKRHPHLQALEEIRGMFVMPRDHRSTRQTQYHLCQKPQPRRKNRRLDSQHGHDVVSAGKIGAVMQDHGRRKSGGARVV
jgi:hypothetical protein